MNKGISDVFLLYAPSNVLSYGRGATLPWVRITPRLKVVGKIYRDNPNQKIVEISARQAKKVMGASVECQRKKIGHKIVLMHYFLNLFKHFVETCRVTSSPRCGTPGSATGSTTSPQPTPCSGSRPTRLI